MIGFRGLRLGLVLWCPLILGGCAVAGLFSVMAQSAEYQKLIEVPPKYAGLPHRSVAVVADADLEILYEHPDLLPFVLAGVAARIARDVEGARVISPQTVIAWQYATPMWNALPYGEMAAQLNVERVVYIEIDEYRLNPPGNRWLWEGVCVADVGVIEREAPDPDTFVDSFQVRAEFPGIEALGRESANAMQIRNGLLGKFVRQTTWLFHLHEEPKYPDKYQGTVN